MGLSLGEKIQTRVGWVILVDGVNEYLQLNQLPCWFFYADFLIHPVLFGLLYHFIHPSVDF
jgi:uncharacterized membrane protein YhdT